MWPWRRCNVSRWEGELVQEGFASVELSELYVWRVESDENSCRDGDAWSGWW